MADAEANNVTELVHVEVPLDGGNQGDGEPELGAGVQGGRLGGPQVPTADGHMGLLGEAVELQVDVGPLGEGGQVGHELAVVGQPDAVGVEVDIPHALGGGEGHEVEDLRVDGRFAAGKHDHLRFAFGADEDVQPGFRLLE